MFKICSTYIFPLKMFKLANRAITVSFGIIRGNRNINMTESECQSNLSVVILKNVQLYIIPFDPLLQFN